MDKKEPRFYTVAQFAKMLGVCKQTAYNLIERGAVAVIRPDGMRGVRISSEAIADYLKKSEAAR